MKVNKKILSSVVVGALIFGPHPLVQAEEVTNKATNSVEQDFMIAQESEGTVEFKFVDMMGNPIHESVYLTGEVGAEYDYTPLDIENYYFVEVPPHVTGTFTEENQTIELKYEYYVKTGEVDVSYEDTDGFDVGPGDIITGNVGDEYTIEPKEFEGYKLVEVVGDTTGVINQEYPQVTFIYEKLAPAKGRVKVNFLDESGKKIKASEYLSGIVGSGYEYYPVNIPDYIITKLEGKLSGTYSKEPQTINVIYDDVLVSSEIQVSYVDQTGNDLAPSEIITGIVGEDYEISPKEISNYNLIDTFGMEKGKFDRMQRGVTFIYAKQEPITISDMTSDHVNIDKQVIDQTPNVSTNDKVATSNTVNIETKVSNDNLVAENNDIVAKEELATNVTEVNDDSITTIDEAANPEIVNIDSKLANVDVIKGEPKSDIITSRDDQTSDGK